MELWFFENIPTFEAKVGFYTEFNVSTPNRDFLHQWKILEVIPQQKIAYDWRYAGIEGAGKITFELIPQGEQTLLRLTNEGLHTFPQDVPEFSRESCQGRWEHFVGRLEDVSQSKN